MNNPVNKNSIVLAIIALFLICSANSTVSAQTNPEQIDVKSLRIVHYANIESFATITWLNSAQTFSSLDERTGYQLAFMNTVIYFPATLNSNGFGSSVSVGFSGSDFRARFYVTSADSSPIVLRPTILRKKEVVKISGTTDVRGRVEVVDQRTLPYRVIAVDNDVRLTGNYTAEFTQGRPRAQRSVRYQSIVYDLKQDL